MDHRFVSTPSRGAGNLRHFPSVGEGKFNPAWAIKKSCKVVSASGVVGNILQPHVTMVTITINPIQQIQTSCKPT